MIKTKITLLSAIAVAMLGLAGPAAACGGCEPEPPCPGNSCGDHGGGPKGNNGWGNGSQDAPGSSELKNGAQNEGGNTDDLSDAPGKSTDHLE